MKMYTYKNIRALVPILITEVDTYGHSVLIFHSQSDFHSTKRKAYVIDTLPNFKDGHSSCLSHRPLGDVAMIFENMVSNSVYRIVA